MGIITKHTLIYSDICHKSNNSNISHYCIELIRFKKMTPIWTTDYFNLVYSLEVDCVNKG